MKPLGVADFKSRFSEILDEVLEGKTIAIQYGQKKAIVAWQRSRQNPKLFLHEP